MWAEIHTSLASQVSVLAFGAAAVGLLMSAAAQLWMTASLVAGLLLLLATPAVCFLALAIYLGEQVRLMRAGFFLYRLEETANQAAGQPQAAVAPDDGTLSRSSPGSTGQASMSGPATWIDTIGRRSF